MKHNNWVLLQLTALLNSQLKARGMIDLCVGPRAAMRPNGKPQRCVRNRRGRLLCQNLFQVYLNISFPSKVPVELENNAILLANNLHNLRQI
jgi:hypothetical protein